MQAAEHRSLHDSVSERQPVFVLVGRDLLQHGLRQTGPNAVCGLPRRYNAWSTHEQFLEMTFVEQNQESACGVCGNCPGDGGSRRNELRYACLSPTIDPVARTDTF